jgi:hypothetical protein
VFPFKARLYADFLMEESLFVLATESSPVYQYQAARREPQLWDKKRGWPAPTPFCFSTMIQDQSS